jgi:hypothetical protein
VPEDAGIESSDFGIGCQNSNYSAIDLIHTRLDLIHARLDLIQPRLDLIHARLDLIHTQLDLIHYTVFTRAGLVLSPYSSLWSPDPPGGKYAALGGKVAGLCAALDPLCLLETERALYAVCRKVWLVKHFKLHIYIRLVSRPLAQHLSNWIRISRSSLYARTTLDVHLRLSKKPGSLG